MKTLVFMQNINKSLHKCNSGLILPFSLKEPI